jgi:hypothetical protein
MNLRKNSVFVLDKLNEEIFSEEIILKYKNNPTDFIRKRKLPKLVRAEISSKASASTMSLS